MADNIDITPGTGKTVATDEIAGSKHVQYVKLMDGTADSATPVVYSSTLGFITNPSGNVAHGATDSGNPVKVGAKYSSTAPTLADGQRSNLYVDVNGFLKVMLASLLAGEDLTNNVIGVQNKPLAVSTYTWNNSHQISSPTTKVSVKASAGNVFSVYVTNENAATRWFQLHRKATAPAATDVPYIALKIPAGTANNPGVLILDSNVLGPAGMYMTTGIGWAISTTQGTFTDSATAAEHTILLNYI